MNIFVLDEDTALAAQYHVDKHVVKMPLETAQLLCSVHHLHSENKNIPYKLTHRNHPCSIWVRESISNYLWLADLGLEICKEYKYRYGKVHKSQDVIEWCEQNLPDLPLTVRTRFVEAMPDEYKMDNPVDSYRNYYINEKEHLFSWKERSDPWWIDKHLAQELFC